MNEQLDPMMARIEANPKYQQLKRRRNRFGWTLTILMWLVYYGYIGLIAFDKELLSRPLGEGVTTLGIPIAVGVILFTITLTGIYVFRANSEYDRLTREVLEEAAQ
ncbi:DUF485 domain-containing protein [Luteimonas sp. e5]